MWRRPARKDPSMRPRIDSTQAQLAARIPARLHHAVKLAAFAAEVTVQDWVAEALEAYLRRCRGPVEPPNREST
jgi:predicted HicB family RNase H-like nuclease